MSGGNLLATDDWRKTFGPKLRAAPALGFVTTRLVTAASRREACELAIESVLQELQESSDLLNANDPSNPPRFEIEQVMELDEPDSDDTQGAGFTFFADDRKLP